MDAGGLSGRQGTVSRLGRGGNQKAGGQQGGGDVSHKSLQQ